MFTLWRLNGVIDRVLETFRVLQAPGIPPAPEMASTLSLLLVLTSKGHITCHINIVQTDNNRSTVIPLQNATVGGVQHDPITYFATFPLPVEGTLPIFATSNSTTVVDDACNPLPDSTPDLSDKVVIIRRGTCTFAQKLENAAAKGAKVALIYECVA